MFGSSPKADIVNLHNDHKLVNKQTMMMTTMSMGADGRMRAETTTETTGTDKNGDIHATRETKSGAAANREAEQMMSNVQNMMGPFGGLLGGLFGQRQPQDPFEALGLGGFGQVGRHHPAHEVLQLRDIMGNPNQRRQVHEHRHHRDQHVVDLGNLIRNIMNPHEQPQMEVVVEIPAVIVGTPIQVQKDE